VHEQPDVAPAGSTGNLLRRAYARFTAEAMDSSLLSRDFVVLDTLADQDAESQHDLAERLGINRTLMVGLIDRLQEAGYVARDRNPANRRAYVLSLTSPGRRALEDMRQEVSDRDARLTAALTKRERRRLIELLSRLLPDPGHPAIASAEYLVAQAHYRLRRLGDALLAGTGLRTRHFGILPAIDKIGPCSQLQLAHYLSITEPAAAESVDELVQAGLVARRQAPDDRRRYALQLTDLGRERLTALNDVARQLQADVLELLGADGDAELRALLTKLLSAGAAGAVRR
jgi:DNA-binding MarR family transcriptional regulator